MGSVVLLSDYCGWGNCVAMDVLGHIGLLARYNQWMNDKLYRTAAQLSADQLAQDRAAFFGSILGTLNHLLVGDIMWLQRLATHPAAHAVVESGARDEAAGRAQSSFIP